MTQEEVVAIVKDTLDAKIGIDEDRLTENASLSKDLAIDSLDILEVMQELEKRFSIKIEDEDVEKVITVGDLFKLILNKLDIK